MSSAESQNPILIVVDTSSVMKLLVTGFLRHLLSLKREYGIQATITPAVLSEVRGNVANNRKFIGRGAPFDRSVNNGSLRVLDRGALSELYGSTAPALENQINAQGDEYFVYIDRGEAYSHAASSVLGVPIVSDDSAAVRRLLHRGETIVRPILRFSDLCVCFFQIGYAKLSDCEYARQELVKISESLSPEFSNCSFETGLQNFYSRLSDNDSSVCGIENGESEFDQRLVIQKLKGG